MKTIAEKLQYLLSNGLTQVVISAQTGIPQGTISRLANGVHKDPRASNAYAIDALFLKEVEKS